MGEAGASTHSRPGAPLRMAKRNCAPVSIYLVIYCWPEAGLGAALGPTLLLLPVAQ